MLHILPNNLATLEGGTYIITQPVPQDFNNQSSLTAHSREDSSTQPNTQPVLAADLNTNNIINDPSSTQQDNSDSATDAEGQYTWAYDYSIIKPYYWVLGSLHQRFFSVMRSGDPEAKRMIRSSLVLTYCIRIAIIVFVFLILTIILCFAYEAGTMYLASVLIIFAVFIYTQIHGLVHYLLIMKHPERIQSLNSRMGDGELFMAQSSQHSLPLPPPTYNIAKDLPPAYLNPNPITPRYTAPSIGSSSRFPLSR